MVRLAVLLLAVLATTSCDRTDNSDGSGGSAPAAKGNQASTKGAMPLSPANCEALGKTLRAIQQNQAAIAREEAYPNENLATNGVKAIGQMGFDPDATLQGIALVKRDARGSCGDIGLLVPMDLDNAQRAGLISPDTQHLYEMQKRFNNTHEEAAVFLKAVSQCEREATSPCKLTDLVRFYPADVKWGSMTFQQAVESRNPQDLSGFAQYKLDCASPNDMQFFSDEKGNTPTCDSLVSTTSLSVNQGAVSAFEQYKALLRQRAAELGLN